MKLITSDLINGLILKAGTSPRQRTNHNVHESLSDPVQRMLIATRRESYFRPHRHPEKAEFALVIQGLFDVLVFDDTGRVTERVSIGSGADAIGFELPPNVWHSWLPMADESAFCEVKQGPYDPATAAEFAAWAPEEGSSPVNGFVARLRNAKVGDLIAWT